ncbi:tigger transposable element-derived protein 1 [Trichonephila clavipes]|nr:tigger transposable element-derived protein 1 [Trichonephila clavipes]
MANRFLKRNALHNIKITGESATVDEGAAKIFPEELAKTIDDGDYSFDQVFNADETGLYWKKLPNRTYIAKDEKLQVDIKQVKIDHDDIDELLVDDALSDNDIIDLTLYLTVDGVVGPEGDNDEEEKSTPLTGKFNWSSTSQTATAGSDVVQSGRPIFDDFFQHLWPYIGNNTANVVFQMVKRLWLIRIDQ